MLFTSAARLLFCLLTALFMASAPLQAQVQRAGGDSLMTIPMVGASFAYNFPGGDMAKRFGNSIEIDGIFMLKTKKNWLFGFEVGYLYADKVRENVLVGLTTADGTLIGADGLYADVRQTMRGLKMPVVKAGRVFSMPFGRAGINSGLFFTVGAGFIQHKIHFEDVTRNAPIVGEQYSKGYDRLTNGIIITQQLGYLFLDSRRRINFFVSAEFAQGFTKVRRSHDFATRSTLDENRVDLLNGLKVGWIFPIYKKLPADFYYY